MARLKAAIKAPINRKKGSDAPLKRLLRVIAWLLLCAAAALIVLYPAGDADQKREAAIRARYGGFSGVLRLWTCEELSPLSGWLNGRIAAFERRHGGVYIQRAEVDEAALRDFAAGRVNPPDMLLFLPGMIEETTVLLPLEGDYPLRAGLERTGTLDETRYALPVAMDTYGVAYNRALLGALPADWSALSERPAASKSFKKQAESYWLDWPRDTAAQSWSAALIALFSGTVSGETGRQGAPTGEGLDLGLSLPSEPTQTPTEAPRADNLIENRLPNILPDSFRRDASVYAPFTRASLAAMPVTQRELRRLTTLSDSGKAPDWAAAASGAAFTDRIALLAVTNCDRTALSERQALCREFAAFLLTEDAQQALDAVHALPVIDTPPLYAGENGLSALEASLSGQTIAAPPAFDNSWRSEAAALADRVVAGEITPQAAWDSLNDALNAGTAP